MSIPKLSNPDLLAKAFTHRSYLNESTTASESNERLEFLGDAVLELVVSQHLYLEFPDKPEGELTALRAALVKTTTLAKIASQLGFGEQLLMSKGEEQGGGRTNQSLLANTFESVIGAIYLDSGYDSANQFISENLLPLLPNIIANNLYKDFKSTFQETVQSQGLPTPTYQVDGQTGPDHNKVFTVSVLVNGKIYGTGKGKSKQSAQQQAAQQALSNLLAKA